MTENEEVWKPVKGYEGQYEVSSLGRVKSLDRVIMQKNRPYHIQEKILEGRKDKNGYRIITIEKHKMRRARLVGFAFPEICGEYFEGAVINHKDENKDNDRPENLEWVSIKANNEWGTRIERIREKVSMPVGQYDIHTGALIRVWHSGLDVEKELGYAQNNISCACRLTYGHKTAYGFIWKYME